MPFLFVRRSAKDKSPTKNPPTTTHPENKDYTTLLSEITTLSLADDVPSALKQDLECELREQSGVDDDENNHFLTCKTELEEGQTWELGAEGKEYPKALYITEKKVHEDQEEISESVADVIFALYEQRLRVEGALLDKVGTLNTEQIDLLEKLRERMQNAKKLMENLKAVQEENTKLRTYILDKIRK